MRLFLGVIIQPFIAAGLAFFMFPLLLLDASGRGLEGGYPGDVTEAAQSIAFGVGIVALFVTLVAVLPTAMWLTKRRVVSLGEALLWGLGFGNVPMVIGTVLAGTYGVDGFVRGVLFSSVLGVAGAALFWTLGLRRRAE